MSKFSGVLKNLRISAGYSQREMARLLGVSFTYISKMENDRSEYPPSEEVLNSIADLFECDRHWLVFAAGKIPVEYDGLLRELAVKWGDRLPEKLQELLED